MKREIIECDNCGAVKRDVNHWWMLEVVSKPVIPIQWRLNIFAWDEEQNDPGITMFVCGEKCCTEMSSRWMRTGKLLADKPESAAKNGSAA